MKKIIQIVVGFVIGFGLLWLLFRGDTDWGAVFASMQRVSVGWLVVGLGVILLSFFTRVQRWSYIVRTAKPVSFRHMFSATQIGFMVNFTLPARAGEVVRAGVLARLAGLPFTKCFAMVALDRVTDLIGLVAVILVAALAYVPQTDIVIPAEVFGQQIVFAAARVQQAEISAVVFLVVSVMTAVLLYVKQDLMLRISDRCVGVVSVRLAERVHEALRHFAGGLHVFRSARDMLKSIFFSLVTWGLFLVVIVVMLWAFDIEGPWYTPFVMQVLLGVAIAVPGAPGFVGQFHVPLVIALVMLVPDMDLSKAYAFAILTHALNLGFIVVVGVFCILLEGLGLGELRHKGEDSEAVTGSAGDA